MDIVKKEDGGAPVSSELDAGGATPLAVVVAPEGPYLAYLASLGPTSIAATESRLKRLLRAIGWKGKPEEFPWHELTPVQTTGIRTWLMQTSAPSTANCTITALKGVLRQCYRLGLMAEHQWKVTSDLKRVPGERVPAGRSVARAELKALFETARELGRGIDARDAAIVATLYGGGLRAREAQGLDLADVDFNEQKMRVKGKGNKHRFVYLQAGAIRALLAYLEHRGREVDEEPALFWSTKGRAKLYPKRIGIAIVHGAIRRLSRPAAVEKFTPHDLRRTFVGDLLDGGADLATVSKLVGHASPSTTLRYDRRNERAKAEAAHLIDVPFV